MTLLVTLLFLFLFATIVLGQGLRSQAHALRKQRALISALLQRRSDLCPLLIETVREYSKGEETLVGDLIAKRARMMQARFSKDYGVGDVVEVALARALEIPGLSQDTAFLEVQTMLQKVADDLTEAMRDYDAAAETYRAAMSRWYAAPARFLFRLSRMGGVS